MARVQVVAMAEEELMGGTQEVAVGEGKSESFDVGESAGRGADLAGDVFRGL